MLKVERIWPALALVSVLSLLVLAPLALWAPGKTDIEPRLRLAINPWPGYEFLYLAGVRKFFEQEGLNVELIQFSTLDDARRSYERGQVDALATTLVDVVQIFHDTGEMPKIVLVVDYSDGGDAIVSLQHRARDAQSLKGKSVAVEQMFGRFILDRALHKQGLELDDVKIVETSVMGASRLLERGSVDAIVTYAPYIVDALKVSGTKQIFSTKDSPEQVFDVVVTRTENLRRIPNLQVKLKRVWKRAMDELESDGEAALEIMARRERVSVPEFKQALADVKLIPSEQQAAMLARSGPVARSLERLTQFTGWTSARAVAGASPEGFLVRPPSVGRED
jgi:NitT/TauT family transport system substrate-binding protein